AGIVEAVGPDVRGIVPGDHVVYSFVAVCGQCPSCAEGHSNLCDNGAQVMSGFMLDGTSRIHVKGQDALIMAGLGTFATHSVVHEWSVVKVLPDLPLDKLVLLGCGATTGWGSSVYAAEVKPGDNVAVIGVGGLGSAAVQGARLAGAERIFAIDPVEFKRESAQKFGATHTAPSVEEALELVMAETWGRGCNKVICTMGVGNGDMMASIMAMTSKRGRVVVTNIHPWTEPSNNIPMIDLTLRQPFEPLREPPRRLAEQLHDRRHEDHAHDRGIEQDGDRHAEPEYLNGRVLDGDEREEHGDHDECGSGDHACGVCHSEHD
ncbi:MAG: hypothetical protein EBS32_12220, partial [Actinobacteria bacterium]|nr:hypothetical protein [Actinomycetota bacterium]